MSTAPSPAARVSKQPRSLVRTDIQGLRAVAVSLVVIYHLFPSRLTGGFAGVDVFFVISGFLITSHLLAHPPRRPADLLVFWSRRIRRLLPASLLVLAVTLVASRLVTPDTQWESTAREVGAATAYVVNWLLAEDSVDYLAAEAAASPVQHFWSLSVEEQFYVGWPLLILLLSVVAGAVAGLRGRVRPATVLAGGMTLVVTASFVWSIVATASSPASAYFVTTTRVWELGAGGLLAAWVLLRSGDGPAEVRTPALLPPLRAASAWAGLAAILWTSASYSVETPFPSWRAALPVLGTVCVIWAAAGREAWSPGRVLALRPMQWLGDVSYSVYLWHWPLIVLLPHVSGGRLGALDKLVVVLATLVLSALTKTYVEDAFRTPAWNARLRGTYLAGAAAMACVLALAGLQVAEAQQREDDAREDLQRALANDDPCFGAGALDPVRDCAPPTGPPVPSPALASKDKSDAYADVSGGKDCWAYLPDFADVTCEFGNPDGDVTVALVGNSHAGHWLPALQSVAEQRGWRIVTHLASRCALSEVRQQFDTADQSTQCLGWVRRTTARVASERPDVVVVSNRISVSVEGLDLEASRPVYGEGYERVLRRWAEAGVPVVTIEDTPTPGDGGAESVPDCLASNPDDTDMCGGEREEWEPDDPVVDAARAIASPDVVTLNLNDRICASQRCSPIVGGAVVYFDASHLTATYARTLSPYLAPALTRRIAR